jgi:L-ascorbate metabolism protein UlaG (beta-lactamase superfamily)
LGVAAYEIITSTGQHIWIDPFLDENPGSPLKSDPLERVDLLLVSHAAFDHFGDTERIARRTGAPVICGGELKAYLCHYINPDNDDVRAFNGYLGEAHTKGRRVPKSVVMAPGEVLTV